MEAKRSISKKFLKYLSFLFVALLVGFLLSIYIMSRGSHYTEVVNLSGKVRGDIQRYAKIYFAGERKKLKPVAEEIDKYLARLKEKVSTLTLPFWDYGKNFKPEKVIDCWDDLKRLTLKTLPSEEIEKKVFQISEECWIKANKITDFYQKISERNLRLLEFLYYLFIILGAAVNLFLLYMVASKPFRRLEFRANYDPLTGIMNRAALHDMFNFVSKDPFFWPISLIMFDLDNFKEINDTYGHNVGDMVLKKVAETIKRHLRRSDIFARWGGEEFVILLPHTDLRGAVKVAEKLRRALEELEIPQLKGRKITASFGVSELRQGESLEEAILRADKALYEAKAKGKNRVEIFV